MVCYATCDLGRLSRGQQAVAAPSPTPPGLGLGLRLGLGLGLGLGLWIPAYAAQPVAATHLRRPAMHPEQKAVQLAPHAAPNTMGATCSPCRPQTQRDSLQPNPPG